MNSAGPRRQTEHVRTITGLLLLVIAIVLIYGQVFHFLMAREGGEYSWFSGVSWTLETMTTLGYGDLTFKSDIGMAFALLVLMTGVVLLFVLHCPRTCADREGDARRLTQVPDMIEIPRGECRCRRA